MFERFTENAKSAVVSAQAESRALKHNFIGTEHLLLGLLKVEGEAAHVLRSLGITYEYCLNAATRIVGIGTEEMSGQIPFTPRTKKTLEVALREALSLGQNYIGSEHVLLAIVRDAEGVAFRILSDFGLTTDVIRDATIARMAERGRMPRESRQTSSPRARVRERDPAEGPSTGESEEPAVAAETRAPVREQPAPLPQPAYLSIEARAVADIAAEKDSMGIAPLVDGLVSLVSDVKTQLPLAIAVTGTWGAGKSSVMRQLESQLLAEGGRSEAPTSQRRRDAVRTRRWRTATFDAWKYERSERLWAALTKAIYESTILRRSPLVRAALRTRLEIERQGALAFLMKCAGAFVPLGVVAGYTLLAGETVTKHGWLLGAAATALLAAVAIVRDWSGVAAVVADPFKRALDAYTVRPRFEGQLGFTSEAEADVQALIRLVTRADRTGLAVFVDDLDRCSPLHVVDVIEAVNQIFNATSDHQTLFVLGMDVDVVAASIEAAYCETVERLPPTRKATFGRDYLKKIVQITIALPEPTLKDMDTLLGSVLGSWIALPELEDSPPEAAIERYRNSLIAGGSITASDVSRRASELAARGLSDQDDAALGEATRIERAKRLRSDSEDVAAAEAELLRHVPRNPRALKQFDNAFRLQLHVANGTPGSLLDFSFDQIIALGKWVILRLRWPDAAQAIDRDASLLGRLEQTFNESPSSEVDDQGDEWKRWMSDEHLAALLTEPNTRRRLANLPFESFIRIA